MEVNKILTGDTLETVKTLPDESIDCVITSPPCKIAEKRIAQELSQLKLSL